MTICPRFFDLQAPASRASVDPRSARPRPASFRDSFDAVGTRTSRVEADGTRCTWTHDAIYQLTRERRSGASGYDVTLAYDSAGNRRTRLASSVITTSSYDAANQLLTLKDNSGTTTHSYDLNGNLRVQKAPGGGLTTNTWDYENRLTRVALSSGSVNTMVYDGDGRRTRKDDSTGSLKAVWDGAKILAETNAADVTQAIHTSSPGVYGDLISQRRGGVTGYFLFDPLGSTDRLVDASQLSTDSYIYQGLGELFSSSGTTSNPFHYVGRLGYYTNPDLAALYVRARPIKSVCPVLVVHSQPTDSLPGLLSVGFPGVNGDEFLFALKDVAISQGAACTAGSPEPSHVLTALGVGYHLARSSFRFGIGRFTTEADIERVASEIARVLEILP